MARAELGIGPGSSVSAAVTQAAPISLAVYPSEAHAARLAGLALARFTRRFREA